MSKVGTNYGLNNSLRYMEVILDSGDAIESYTTGISALDWPVFDFNMNLSNIAALKVISAEIPFSYYVFNSTNNTFILTEAVGGPRVVTIPVGNYTVSTFITALEAALNAASATASMYTVTVSSTTGKITVTSNGGPFTFTFGTSPTDAGITNPRLWMGFNAGSISSTIVGGSQTIVAPNVFNLTGPNYLYLNSNRLGPMVAMDLPVGAARLGSDTSGPQIAKMQVNTNPGATIFYQDPDPLYWFDMENFATLQRLDLYFTMGNIPLPSPLQLNGAQFSIKLGILFNRAVHNDVVSGDMSGVINRALPDAMRMMY